MFSEGLEWSSTSALHVSSNEESAKIHGFVFLASPSEQLGEVSGVGKLDPLALQFCHRGFRE